APCAQAMLQAARAALAQAKAAGDKHAHLVQVIGIASAYRDPPKDFGLWDTQFDTFFEKESTQHHEYLQYTDNAAQKIIHAFQKKKALPGFSNHTAGRALDMRTTEDGVDYGASSSDDWEKTWLRQWLLKHSGDHKFEKYSEEAWHWNFIG